MTNDYDGRFHDALEASDRVSDVPTIDLRLSLTEVLIVAAFRDLQRDSAGGEDASAIGAGITSLGEFIADQVHGEFSLLDSTVYKYIKKPAS